MSDRILNRER